MKLKIGRFLLIMLFKISNKISILSGFFVVVPVEFQHGEVCQLKVVSCPRMGQTGQTFSAVQVKVDDRIIFTLFYCYKYQY